MLKALVISPNEKTVDFGSLLSIAHAETCRREQVQVNTLARALVFVAEFGVYVVCGVLVEGKVVDGNSVIRKLVNEKVYSERSGRGFLRFYG